MTLGQRRGKITAEQFEREYAERCGVSVEELRSWGRVVAPCECDYEGCEGWASVSKDQLADHLRFYGPVEDRV